MIQSEILPRPRHPPLSFNSSSQQHNCRRAIRHSLFFERIRGFRFSMAAGSQSVESLGEKAGPSPAGEKNPFFLGYRTLFNSRASPERILIIRYFSFIFTIHMFLFTFFFPKPPESEVACTHGLIDPICSVSVRRAFTTQASSILQAAGTM